MKKLLVSLGSTLALLAVLAGCDKDELPEAWVWSLQDSVDVMELLEPQAQALSSAAHLPSGAVGVAFSEELLAAVRSDTSYDRYLVREFSFALSDSVYAYDFILGTDTTVTAYVLDSLEGTVELVVDSILERGSDSATALDTTLTKTLRYSSWGAVFFDSLGGDGKWRTARYSGGSQGAMPALESSPDFDSVALSYEGGELTVVGSADPDVYGIKRLFDADELLHLSSGTDLKVEDVWVSGADTLLIYVKAEQDWLPYEQGVSLTFSRKGMARLYLIGIAPHSLLDASEQWWEGVVWGITVVVE